MNIHYNPEHFGLEAFGTIDWPADDWGFDITAVWRRAQDGVFLATTDSGYSCPTPFEDVTLDTLTVIGSLDQFQVYCDEQGSGRTPQIVTILERMYQAGLR
jgi:hypothetical protein